MKVYWSSGGSSKNSLKPDVHHSLIGLTDPSFVASVSRMGTLASEAVLGFSFSDWIVVIASAIASYTDLRREKIYNVLTFTVMTLGFVAQAAEHGGFGILSALAGIATAVLLLGWLFVIGAMGAGDVKLLMAFGAVGGARYCLDVAVLSLGCGVILAIVWMAKERKFRQTADRIFFFFVTLFHREFEAVPLKTDDRLRVPYGFALGVAAVWLRFGDPLAALGWTPWR